MSSPRSRFPFAILSWGGIGDTLRNLSLIPHAALFKKYGWRTPVVHQPWQEVGCREDALPPGPAAIRELVVRCPSLIWGGVGILGATAKISNRLFRETLTLRHGGVPPIYPFEIRLTMKESTALPRLDASRLQVAIQTHLLGMTSKKWQVSRWQVFLQCLRRKLPAADFHFIEPSGTVSELCLDDHFHPHPDFNLAQSIALVRQMDFVISIDSWVKCIAACDHIPQAIIIPDRRADYPNLTAESFLRHEFATLKARPEANLFGLDIKNGIHTLPPMSEVDPETLFAQIEPHLSEDRKRKHPPVL